MDDVKGPRTVRGTMLFFEPDKYGFIRADGGECKDVYVSGGVLRHSGLDVIRPYDKVEVDFDDTPRGPRARYVRLINDDEKRESKGDDQK